MDKKYSSRFNETQPNSTPREELLIVIEYLNNYAYDEKHASSQADILRYAKEKYNVEIRRDRIGQILIHLEQLAKKSPQLLPFTLKTVELNAIKKYYVPQRVLPEDDIVNILGAIKSSPTLSPRQAKRLYDKFLNSAINKSFHEEVNSKVQIKGYKEKFVRDDLLEAKEKFEDYALKQTRIVFKLSHLPKPIEFTSSIPYKEMKKLLEPDNYGFVAKVYTIGNATYAVIYWDKYRVAFITEFENIEITDEYDLSQWHSEKIKYTLDNCTYPTINDWLDAHFKGQDGFIRKYKLKVTTNDKAFFNRFKREFETYWDKPLTYKIVERVIPFHFRDVNGNDSVIDQIAYDAVFEIEANTSSFENWYINNGNFDEVVILEPAHLNDHLLSEKIIRYAKRLTKYGTQYNYHVEREMKPEYKEYRDKMMKRREEFLARRNSQRKKTSQ